MKQLNGFFEIDGILLYASKDICAFDPIISVPIPRAEKKFGKQEYTAQFQLGELDFFLEFKNEMHGGPLRGREGIKVFHDGQTLIDWAIGGMGHGSNFSSGKKWYISPDYFLLLTNNGHKFEDYHAKKRYRDLPKNSTYLLLFKSYSIPPLLPARQPQKAAAKQSLKGKYFFAEQIEELREDIWKTELETADGTITLVQSGIKGYGFYSNTGDRVLYEGARDYHCRKRTIITYKGQKEEFTSVV